MSVSKNAKILLSALKKWEQPNRKLIVGIDGYSGAGKTTLLKEVAEMDNEVLIVSRDDFAYPRGEFEAKFKNTKTEADKVSILVNGTVNVQELTDFLNKYKRTDDSASCNLRGEISGVKDALKEFDFSKKVLLLEGIFLFHHDHFSDIFDKKVFIDIDQELADRRRREREKQKWGKDYFPDTHPDSYSRLIKIGFIEYLVDEKPAEQADLIIKSH
jgi:uridine kinase